LLHGGELANTLRDFTGYHEMIVNRLFLSGNLIGSM
jgi:hypothetical protein